MQTLFLTKHMGENGKMAKRYYKIGETLWIKPLKVKGQVTGLDVQNLQAQVAYSYDGFAAIATFPFTEVDKLRAAGNESYISVKKDTVLFAKVRPDAIVPSKRAEDAGYDIYANFPQQDITLKKGVPTLIPTGIASSMLPKYYFNVKHERGSTGKIGMSVLSGVVDSGYRNEWFVNIVATNKDIVISKNTTEVVELEKAIYYPYNKAIAQATLELVPDVNIKVIDFESLSKIRSERGKGKLGSSGK
jgi:dUTP pyrophosphatase